MAGKSSTGSTISEVAKRPARKARGRSPPGWSNSDLRPFRQGSCAPSRTAWRPVRWCAPEAGDADARDLLHHRHRSPRRWQGFSRNPASEAASSTFGQDGDGVPTLDHSRTAHAPSALGRAAPIPPMELPSFRFPAFAAAGALAWRSGPAESGHCAQILAGRGAAATPLHPAFRPTAPWGRAIRRSSTAPAQGGHGPPVALRPASAVATLPPARRPWGRGIPPCRGRRGGSSFPACGAAAPHPRRRRRPVAARWETRRDSACITSGRGRGCRSAGRSPGRLREVSCLARYIATCRGRRHRVARAAGRRTCRSGGCCSVPRPCAGSLDRHPPIMRAQDVARSTSCDLKEGRGRTGWRVRSGGSARLPVRAFVAADLVGEEFEHCK